MVSEALFKTGDVTTCKHCGHSIIRLEQEWFHNKGSELQSGEKLVHSKDGSVNFRCSVNGCGCINAQPVTGNGGD